jgi:hypothetical protein
MTLQDCFAVPKPEDVISTQIHKRMKVAVDKTKQVSRIIQGDRKAFIEAKLQKKMRETFNL